VLSLIHRTTNNRKTILGNFMIGATSAMIAEAIAFPFDSLKTRMQLQGVGAGSAASNLSPFQQAFALYYGVGIALFRHIPYSGTRQMLYQTVNFSPNAICINQWIWILILMVHMVHQYGCGNGY
jgi:hypothetical protein